jgi:hypothetical protein
MYAKIKDYYLNSSEYQTAQLEVYDFCLRDIIRCILDEPVGRQVVFLLTASMAYAFGGAQKNLLQTIQSELNACADELLELGELERSRELRGKIWGVSVIGHCMYGCMSCKGNDHKVPVYYTRYFKGK